MRRDDGDLDAGFAAFVRARGERHLRLAALLTGDWHAAEDLVQASLIKLYQAWPRLRSDAEPDAYLRRIMINTHRSWWRVQWRREKPAQDLPDLPAGPDIADAHATSALVRQALARLPRQQRAVLVLRYFEDLSEADVAALLHCSPGSVKTHAHRGIRRLRELLGDDWAESEVNHVPARERDEG